MSCSVCSGTVFARKTVLWRALIDEWQLCEAEAAYIDRQQGETCQSCGANLRSMALANAFLSAIGAQGALLLDVAKDSKYKALKILEINEAGSLTPVLKQFNGHVFGAYPQLDMHALPFSDAHFDVLIHSDTLEHVVNPVHALGECRRVLKGGGALCFTVPIIVGRVSRDRSGLPASFHGQSEVAQSDMLVQTEFGVDAWTYVMRAGFANVSIHSVEYPAALAFCARK